MTASALRVSATTLTMLIAGGAAILAAVKPAKPVTTVAATMTFRCYTSPDLPDDPACAIAANTVSVSADHVGDEGYSPYRLYEGGVLGSTSAYLKVTGTGRAFRLFLHAALAPGPEPSRIDECDADGALAGCNPDDRLPLLYGSSMLLSDAEVNIKVLHPTTLEDASLTAMACNAPGLALVHFTAWLPGGEGHWGLNFNRRAYHSTGATITRTGSTTWVVEATTDDYAELVSFGHSNIQRRQGPSHEGRYKVPFRLTIETGTALPTGAATCSS